jgi:hypothetical protein
MKVVSDIKHTFNSWQHRLPNLWDDIYYWNELLRWRQRVFGFITDSIAAHDSKNLSPSEKNVLTLGTGVFFFFYFFFS